MIFHHRESFYFVNCLKNIFDNVNKEHNYYNYNALKHSKLFRI